MSGIAKFNELIKCKASKTSTTSNHIMHVTNHNNNYCSNNNKIIAHHASNNLSKSNNNLFYYSSLKKSSSRGNIISSSVSLNDHDYYSIDIQTLVGITIVLGLGPLLDLCSKSLNLSIRLG